MDAHGSFPFLKETILFLALSGVLMPLLSRLRINAVLGFLSVGVLLGPYGLASLAGTWPALSWFTFARPEDVEFLAELGVIFLMFMIGLEMSVERLWSMRRLVFGLGGLQVALSAAAVGGLALWFGNSIEAAVILGVVLAFSSTAIVMQLLIQRRELGTPLGQSAFAILLFQDLAVVPLLVLISILGAASGEGSFASLLGTAVVKGVLTVVGIYLVGRRVVRPLFHQITVDKQPDTFTALTLLTTLGVAALTWYAGLSMALGALLAGLIIAETEFRHEVEITIEPFKGLLMGLFFMSVGMGIDLRALLAEPLWIPLSVVGLLAMKAAIIFVLLRVFGLSWGRSAEGGLLLGQGGEFAFIVIGMALTLGLLERQVGQFMLIVVGVSMLVAPVVARLGQSLGDNIDRRAAPPAPEDTELGELGGHVIIAGYGRVGQMVGQMLAEQGVAFVAIENDAKLIAHQRKAGVPLVFGDASRPELLRKLRIDQARAVVLTMDHTAAAIHAVQGIRRLMPMMRVIARARDEKHALLLREAGASVVVPETLESSLKLTGWVLETLGVPPDATLRLLEQERERRIVALRDTPPGGGA
ncbi:Glutathione-regulated potassium-efflux system protein KefC [Thauera sp. GDN1]|uniref:cation:proton antiporter domain-containing protein n=1 Tax=Thauera sp. GDN1 TaxID=2944810 RepID=UPI00247AB1DC|nr:cation:proton antiporter [Thauera sp. GDN1]WEN43504.1 Glutathione-regulated potassium-efflux system protein KefC [Thauera sp. GDN1]